MSHAIAQDLSIRRPTTAEEDSLPFIHITAYSEYRNELSPEHWGTMKGSLENREAFRKLLDIATAFVCLHEDRIIGSIYLVPHGNPNHIFPADWTYIRLLGVLPAYQGRGIGRMLTEACIAHARSIGAHTLALHTSEFQPAARHIYESMGFAVHSELQPTYGKKYWLYTLNL